MSTSPTWPRLLVVDVEGNGQQPPDLVEIALIPVEGGLVRPEEARSTLVRPPQPITRFATGVHGLTNQDVEAAPPWETIADRVLADLHGAWIVAHNASTEYNVLTRHLPTWQPAGVLDTLRLARAVHPAAPGHGLDKIIPHLGIDLSAVPGQRHRAAFDAHATALLLLTLADRMTFAELMAAAVPPNMPGAPAAPDPDHEEQTLW
ncbi:DNA polymerase III epsilon subunit-like protein [Kitasatospora gansuensis]|uniref:DNA polymerase III epsilon subunit-like protein n=1 Tax=Kitasatospora gansuensis TaxID=258050 RepID=A0A7W7WLM2_9ACTN|nr:3'-5' exonuclease [Kitasatospora gansuensis]MBB4951225.1 DNA polymerase III epsilon subunit-like protein [Kitasatospora gansuensis]